MIPYHEFDHSSKIHLYCVWKRKPAGRKTPIYSIRKNAIRFCDGADELGEIRWFGAFRQFVFCPHADTLWSKGCLEIINTFLQKINSRYRRKRNATH
jgi:hypothetical protein